MDWNSVVSAQARAVLMMKKLAGGEICSGRVDINLETGKSKSISLRVRRLNQLLGASFNTAQVRDLLSRLGMEVANQSENMEVKIHTWQ